MCLEIDHSDTGLRMLAPIVRAAVSELLRLIEQATTGTNVRAASSLSCTNGLTAYLPEQSNGRASLAKRISALPAICELLN